MSTLKVSVERISRIDPHPNAERLELATVLGWQCVVQKDRYSTGSLIVYIPIDSVLPNKLEEKIFGPESKVKLTRGRVKTIKLRGQISQGLVIDLGLAGIFQAKEGDDVTSLLGITKYEPPTPGFQNFGTPGQRRDPNPNPNLSKYTSIENIKNFASPFAFDEEVVVTEKLHGTNFRCGWVKHKPQGLWQWAKKLIGLSPSLDFVYGSHNVQLDNKHLVDDGKPKTVYAKAVMKYRLKEKLKKMADYYGTSVAIYGEIIGPGIQKGYHYDVPEGELQLVLFDAKIEHVVNGPYYIDHVSFTLLADELGMATVPVLYMGHYGKADMAQLVSGNSIFAPGQKIREGAVVRSPTGPRKILKAINPEYLLGDQSDFH